MMRIEKTTTNQVDVDWAVGVAARVTLPLSPPPRLVVLYTPGTWFKILGSSILLTYADVLQRKRSWQI